MNFKSNLMLKILYFLVIVYLWLSARQIARGFPIYRSASSLLESENPEFVAITLGVFSAIPFFIELRLVVDWVSSKTSLDINQFAQAFNYHLELF